MYKTASNQNINMYSEKSAYVLFRLEYSSTESTSEAELQQHRKQRMSTANGKDPKKVAIHAKFFFMPYLLLCSLLSMLLVHYILLLTTSTQRFSSGFFQERTR